MIIDYETLGPQGQYVAALIQRCQAMTPQEAELLACARSPSLRDRDDGADERYTKAALKATERLVTLRAIARGAASQASSGVDRDTHDVVLRADDLARRAARPGGPHTGLAAAKATTDTIIALVARDLIHDSDEWGWEQYHTLVAAWHTAIGPAHPDDTPHGFRA